MRTVPDQASRSETGQSDPGTGQSDTGPNPYKRRPGNPKGTNRRRPNSAPKAHTTVKEAFRQAFDQLGGAEGLARWASTRHKVNGRWEYPNLAAFYQLATKLIPSETLTTGQIGHAHYVARAIPVEAREALPVPVDSSRTMEMMKVAEDATEVIDFIG